ncbi:MAG: hypothetical protein ACW99G_20775 [Candidatus Thorarchaeota archaeon]
MKKNKTKDGGHGNHWAAVFDTEDETHTAILDSVNKEELIEQKNLVGGNIVVYDSVGEHIRILTITVDNQVWTSYPHLVNGIPHEVEVESVEEWKNDLEGQIQGSLYEATVSFFDTRYLEEKEKYKDVRKYRFSLSALAYALEVVEYEPHKKGEIGMAKGFAGFFPAFSGGDVDDYTFGSYVKEIVDFDFLGRKFYRIRAPLFKSGEFGESGDVDIYIYVPQKGIQGSKPKMKDDISGAIWMQGHLV